MAVLAAPPNHYFSTFQMQRPAQLYNGMSPISPAWICEQGYAIQLPVSCKQPSQALMVLTRLGLGIVTIPVRQVMPLAWSAVEVLAGLQAGRTEVIVVLTGQPFALEYDEVKGTGRSWPMIIHVVLPPPHGEVALAFKGSASCIQVAAHSHRRRQSSPCLTAP